MEGFAQTNDRACLIDALADAEDSATVGELRAMCREQQSADLAAVDAERIPVYERSAMDERIAVEQAAENRPFLITAHQPNYLLFAPRSGAATLAVANSKSSGNFGLGPIVLIFRTRR